MYTAGNLLLSDLFHVFSPSLLTAHGEIVPHCRALQTPSAVRPPGRLIASIVLVLRSAQREGGSSLCGIAIVAAPSFLVHLRGRSLYPPLASYLATSSAPFILPAISPLSIRNLINDLFNAVDDNSFRLFSSKTLLYRDREKTCVRTSSAVFS